MGTTGRKKQTFEYTGIAPSSVLTRNLRKGDLGGVIFGCMQSTIKECLSKQLFGLPAQHFSYVKNIDPGLPLLLFNYSDRKLHGIFEAASCGQMNINPYGWTTNGLEKTLYPAQVQIRVQSQCQPLCESQFKSILADNYYSYNHFWFELDHAQTSQLMSLLASFPVIPSAIETITEKNRTIFRAIPPRVIRLQNEGLVMPASEAELSNPNHSSQKSDSVTVVSSLDEENQTLETERDLKVVQQEEKDLVCTKLRELVFKRSLKNEGQELSSSGDVEGTSILLDDKISPGPLRTSSVKDSTIITDVPFGERDYSREMINSNDKNYEQIFGSSSDSRSVISQLIQEVEELKVFKTEQTQRMVHLEKKLVQAETEIQELKRHLLLQSESNPSLMLEDEEVVKSFDDLNLDLNETIILSGGFNGELWLSSMDLYHPSQDQIKSLRSMNSVRSYASISQLSKEFYVIGGGDGLVWYDTVESYSPVNDQWTLCPSLSQKKGSLAAATVNDKIFAMGGGNGKDCFSDVEMLDLDMGRWILTRSMLQKRFALAAVELNGAIYATGGYNGINYLSSVERFDPREHEWTSMASMNERRGCHSLVALNDKLYALGGFDGDKMVPNLEIFDPRLGTWMTGEPMKHSRGYGVAVVVKDSVYAIGGVENEARIVETVDVYKEGYGWQETTSKVKRCFLSAIAFESLAS